MIGGHPVTTKNRYMASLLLKEDDSAGHLERDRRAPLKHLYRIRCGSTHEGGSSKVGIHGQGSSESIASASQQKGSIGLHQFHFMLNTHHAYIDAGPDSLRVVKVPSASGWYTQPSVWESDPPTTDAVQAYAEPGAILYSDMRRILEQPMVISPWGVGSPLQPRSSRTESPTATADLARFGKDAIWAEMLERLDDIAQREDNWDGYESKKPNELSLDNARQFARQFFNAIASEDPSRFTPLISSDEDGHITVEWHGEGRQLHLQIEEDEIDYIQVWGPNIDTEMHVDTLHSKDYLTLWKWLIYGTK